MLFVLICKENCIRSKLTYYIMCRVSRVSPRPHSQKSVASGSKKLRLAPPAHAHLAPIGKFRIVDCSSTPKRYSQEH